MSVLQAWCRATAEMGAEGLVTLSNIVCDCVQVRVPEDRLRQFFEALVQRWRQAEVGRSPTKLIRQIVEESPEVYFCVGKPRDPEEIACSHICEASRFIRTCVDAVGYGWLEAPDYVPDEWLDILERGPLRLKNTASIPDAEARARNKLCGWVTKTQDIDKVRKDEEAKEPLADRVRNLLGLMHYGYPCELVEICYPADACREVGLAPPTFLDGAPYLIFRSRGEKATWGTAVNLSDLKDGLPEAVHRPIALTERFKIRRVGWTTESWPLMAYEDLWRGSAYPWEEKLVAVLEEFLSSPPSSIT